MKLNILKRQVLCVLAALSLVSIHTLAQLSTNPDKFLGNITTDWPGSMDYDGFVYSDYWNQVTPENGTKWGTVEGTRNSYYWSGADPAYNYARQKGFPFKFHCLVWGSQYPSWLKNLSAEARYQAIVKWMDTVKKKYPNLEMIDVVNEAVEGHQADTYLMREALGGSGETGYDWIIRAFEMAHERWPDAILIYNDFNTFQWNTDQFIDLVRTLRDAGAPIDAYGCQSHDLGGVNQATFKTAMTKIQNALKMPMYITEYDIGDTNDANQKWNFQQHFPVMWEADYCAGVTLWGWFYGHTWIKDDNTGESGISGLIKDKKERSALTWLREYMQTDKAKNAKSPFPGMKKEASVYVKPAALKGLKDEPVSITVRASLKTKTIESVSLYAGTALVATMTEAPYVTEFTPTTAGTHTLKAVVTATDGTTYERLSRYTAVVPLEPGEALAGTDALLGSKPFAMVNKAEERALYGKDFQNLGYDDYSAAFNDANSGYLFKAQSVTVNGNRYYLLRPITPAGGEYSVWGSPGYLNTQPATGDCSFILGLNNQNGQDIRNGAVWDIQYVEGRGFTLKNVGTGLYLTGNGPANSETPVYWTLCSLRQATSGIASVKVQEPCHDDVYYDLGGRRVSKPTKGLYIQNGRKVVLK